jgi:hypothetical protein
MTVKRIGSGPGLPAGFPFSCRPSLLASCTVMTERPIP